MSAPDTEKEAALPFSLKNRRVQQSMERLGILEKDLEIIPLVQFLKEFPTNQASAKSLYQRHMNQRHKYIEMIKEDIKKPPQPSIPKPASSSQATTRQLHDDTNKDILRHLAVSVFRQLEFIDNAKAKSSKADALAAAHEEKLRKKLNEAYDVAQAPVQQSQRARSANASIIPYCHSSKPRSSGSIEEHIQRFEEMTVTKKQKLLDMEKSCKEDVEQARLRAEKLNEDLISKRLNRIGVFDERASKIAGKIEEKQEKLNQRAEKREKRTQETNERNVNMETKRVEKVKQKLETETKKAIQVTEAVSKEMEEKISSEKNLLDKRYNAANQIFEQQKQRKESFRKSLEERDISILNGLSSNRGKKENDLFGRLLKREDHTDEVKRKMRQREMERRCYILSRIGLEESSSRGTNGSANTDDSFSDLKKKLLESGAEMEGMDETERIEYIKDLLQISEDEAKQIIELSKQPPSVIVKAE